MTLVRYLLVIGIVSSLPATGCYTASFTPSGSAPWWYKATARDPGSVKMLTLQPEPGLYTEVGLISASGAGSNDAIRLAREEAGARGCDAILMLGEAVESGPGTPGSAFGQTRNHVRASCLIESPASEAAAKTVHVEANFEPSASEECVPACRDGFVCLKGACVSACNPPCGDGQRCTIVDKKPNCVNAPPAP